jgi:transcriptional regulator with XRE-family HTH domain
MAENFGDKLRRLRTSRGLTLEALAEKVGSSKAYVWQLENKAAAKPSAELLLKLAATLGEAPEFFLDDSTIERSESHVTEAFFRKFNKLSPEDRHTIERIVTSFHDKSWKEPD